MLRQFQFCSYLQYYPLETSRESHVPKMDKIQIVRVPSGPPLESAVDTLEKSPGYVKTPIFHDCYESELISVIWRKDVTTIFMNVSI